MATMKQTVILAFVVLLGFSFTDAVALPSNTEPPPGPPPGKRPKKSVVTNSVSSHFVYLFHRNAILDYDAEQRRISLVGTDIFGGEIEDNEDDSRFKPNRTARFDLDLVFGEVKREVKDCVRNEFLGGNDIRNGDETMGAMKKTQRIHDCNALFNGSSNTRGI